MLLAAAGVTPAQEQPGRPQQAVGGYTLVYDRGVSWVEGPERLLLFSGSVELTGPEVSLRADRLLVWTRPDEPGLKLREIYAEGNVVSRRVDAKTKREVTLRAERLYYDFAEHRAYVVDLSGRLYLERLRSPVVVRAKEAREVSQGKWRVKDLMVTTCTYGHPHYHVHFENATLHGDRPREGASQYEVWPYDEWNVRGEGMTADIFGLPVFFWPVLAFGSAVAEFPIRSLRGGHSKRFGYWMESDWGLTIPKGLVDSINPFDSSTADDDAKKWGEFNWEADWRRRRGWAAGIDMQWRTSEYNGYIDTYGLHDLGGDPDIDFDKQFIGQYRKDRGRARLFHRHEVASGWRAEVEASYLSDRALLPEFFETEFKSGKEQETAAYVRWLDGSTGAYLLGRARLNDFQTQNEYLPRLRGFVHDLPVALGATWTAHADAAYIRARFDDDLALPTEDVLRLDVVNELSRPIDLVLATVSPFARIRNTLYHEDLQGEDEHRLLATAGVRVSTQVSGVHDLTWEDIGLRRLRHVMTVEAAYTHNLENTLDPTELFGFDGVDRLDRFEEIAFEMRHRFATKVPSGEALASHDFLSMGAAVEYYPEAGRDTTSVNANNVEAPFHWITLAPHDTSGVLERRLWSNIHWDLSITPRKLFAVSAAGEYNPVHRQEEIREYTATFTPAEGFRASVGEVFVKNVTTAFTMGLDWQITEKWRVQASGQYDFELDKFLNWRAVLTRDFHDFNVELVAEVDETRDERRVYVTAYPKFIRRRNR